VGVPLLTYRRDIQTELGHFVVNTTTTGASDSVSFTCASLVSANAADSYFKGCWAYLNETTGANLAAQRKVAASSGFDPDQGSVTVARAFSTTVTSGVGFEISFKVPAITDEMGIKGVREYLNDTLLAIPPIDLLPVTAVTSQEAYDVTTTYPWLTRRDQILGIYFQNPEDEIPKPTGVRFEWSPDVDTPKLLLPGEPYVTGETFYLKARRPAQTWIETNGTWATDTDGLQNDTDEALPLRSVVKAQTLTAIYRWLGAQDGPGEYRAYYREREAFWSQKAYALRYWTDEREHEDTTPRTRMVYLSSAYGGRRSYQ
jgi:hypothetical protein